ncbi:MAG: lysophospholipid acyltransferase family protein [Acidimicrobiia bacterium]
MADERTPGAGAELAVSTGSGLMAVVGRWFDLQVSGTSNIPRRGSAVLAINHLSHLDVIVTTHVARRNVRYLALDELYGESQMFDRLLGYFGSIPLSRTNTPLGALRTALDHLDDDGLVGVFPEGRRVGHWGESPFKQGAAWLSLRSGVPLIAVSIVGTEESLSVTESALRRTSVRVWADPPLFPDEFRDEPDPRAAMTAAWAELVAHRVGHWVPAPEDGAEQPG